MAVFHASANMMRDASWVRQSFMMSGKSSDPEFERWRLQTLASQKFTDTRLGGNFTINNLPQYTRYADIRVSGLNSVNQKATKGKQNNHLGMGRFYEEQVDRNASQIFMRFGVPAFQGMLSFFTSFYDGNASLLAREGRAPGIMYYLGRAAGLYFTLPILPYILAGQFVKFIFQKPSSKYYYMKPTMPLYWNRCNYILNHLAVNMQLVPRVFGANDGATPQEEGVAVSKDLLEYAHTMAPDIFRKNGGIDIYAVANKAQRMADARYNQMIDLAEQARDAKDLQAKLKEHETTLIVTPEPRFQDKGDKTGMMLYLEDYHNGPAGNMNYAHKEALANTVNTDASQLQAEKAPGSEGEKQPDESVAYQKELRSKYRANPNDPNNPTTEPGYGDEPSFWDSYFANRRDGSDFIGFKVDFPGTVSESFSSSTKESEMASKINGMSSSARSARFDFSDGNTGIGMLDGAMQGLRDVVTGALDQMHVSGLLSLAGSALVDFPKQWESSSASMPSASYTIELRTPYGNPLSRFMNLYVPLACLLAAALPISTGKQSYTSPFLCEMYHRGRNQIKMGMITSLSITRGTGNLGFNNRGEALGIDVSFEITDFSSIMHMPIDASFLSFDEDNAFTDYMAVLGNLSIADQVYSLRKLAINLTRKREQIDTFFSRAHFALALDNTWIGNNIGAGISAVMRGSERLIQ